jgi:hypothetical protein
MSTDRKASRAELLQVAEFLSALVLDASDDELEAAARQAGLELGGAAERGRRAYSRALTSVGKSKMRLAKAGLKAARPVVAVPSALRDPANARAFVDQLIKQSPESSAAREKLTLAARSGTSMTDEDIQSLLDDLARLGELPPGDGE